MELENCGDATNREYFVDANSIVRRIWGKSDTILFIFAGAAAEFALNKAVDWLYFTGRLPVDPIGRLFSTVSYARAIVFSEKEAAHRAIDMIVAIHGNVESNRGASIPDWAYRDVLFMLTDYSIRSFELLERPMTPAEKVDVFAVFHNIGVRMGLTGLPPTFDIWKQMRQHHLRSNLEHSSFTDDLFRQYARHLGRIRFHIMIESQILMVPRRVNELLKFRTTSWLRPVILLYKFARRIRMEWVLKNLILPSRYRKQISALDA